MAPLPKISTVRHDLRNTTVFDLRTDIQVLEVTLSALKTYLDQLDRSAGEDDWAFNGRLLQAEKEFTDVGKSVKTFKEHVEEWKEQLGVWARMW